MSAYEPWRFSASKALGTRDANATSSPSASALKDLPDLTASMRVHKKQERMSHMSLVAKFMALDPITRDLFEERAAILEESSGMTRHQAERMAFKMVMQAHQKACE